MLHVQLLNIFMIYPSYLFKSLKCFKIASSIIYVFMVLESIEVYYFFIK